MKKLFFLFLLSFLLQGAQAQLACPQQYRMRIIARAGLNMRLKPTLNSHVVTTVPYDSTLLVCKETEGTLTIDGLTGYWRKATYRGAVGYMFDGFMEVVEVNPRKPYRRPDSLRPKAGSDTAGKKPGEKPEATKEPKAPAPKPRSFQFLTETYNYCGDVKEIDPGLLWYGIYPPDPDKKEIYYRIEPVELEVVLSRSKVGSGMEFDIQTEREERSIFLIGTNRLLKYRDLNIEDHDQQLRYAGRKVFPGQELSLGEGNEAYHLSATGSVTKSGPCPELKNYSLSLSRGPYTQDLTKILKTGKCGMPEIFWYGDLTGDGYPEIIFVSQFEDKNTFTLLVSENTREGQLLRPEAEWIVEKCD